MSLVIDAFAESWGYRWDDFVSNQRLLRETDSRPITYIVRQRQLRLYGHVARYPYVDPAHRVVSVGHVSCQEELSMRKGPAW